MTRRLHVFGPLVSVALAMTLSFLELWKHAWIPFVVLAWVLALSLAGAMWRVVRRGRRSGELVVALCVLPVINVMGSLWVFGAWPAAARVALEQSGRRDDAPTDTLFAACGVLWAAAATGLALRLYGRSEIVGLVSGALWVLFFLFWLPASRQALAVIEALDEGVPQTDAPASEWSREREAVRAALIRGAGAERAWADDVIARHARRGEREAQRWAEAIVSDDPSALLAALDDQST